MTDKVSSGVLRVALAILEPVQPGMFTLGAEMVKRKRRSKADAEKRAAKAVTKLRDDIG